MFVSNQQIVRKSKGVFSYFNQPSNEKFERLGSPLDEIVLFSVHRCYVVIGRRDIIRELGNCCNAGLLYFICYKCI